MRSYGEDSRQEFRKRQNEQLAERFRERFDLAQAAFLEDDRVELARQTYLAAGQVSAVDGRPQVRAACDQVAEYEYHPSALSFLRSVADRLPPVIEDQSTFWTAAVQVAGGADAATDQLERALATVEVCGVYDDLIPSKIGEPTYTLGEDFESSELHQLYQKRERQGRSLQAIIVARDNATGTGKTTLAVQLCKKWGDDWHAGHATNRPGEYRDFLNNKPEGTTLLADEIGQMYDSRRSMSSENVEVSQDWQMIRTKRYKTLSTLPGPSFLDKRLKKLADVIIVCTRRGHARVYKTKTDDATGDLWRKHLCNVEWGAIDSDEDYQQIEEMKRQRLKERFEGGGDDEPELTESDLEAVEAETRDELLRSVYEETELTQQELADATELSRSRLADILSQ